MKTFIILLFTINPLILFAQTDTTYLIQYDSATYAQVSISYDEKGRQTQQNTIYIDSTDISQNLFDQVLSLDNQERKALERAEKNLKAYNLLKKQYKDFTGENYSNAIAEKKRKNIDGDWKLIVSDTVYLVTTDKNKTLKDKTLDLEMKVKYERNELLKLSSKNSKLPFFVGDAYLEERYNNNGIYFVGKTDMGDKVILKK